MRAKRSRRCRSAPLFAKMCKFSPCVGAWKSKHQHESSAQAIKQKLLPSATRLLFAQISNKDGKAKTFANSKPICGVGYMPRRWRNFATQTARRRLFSRRMPGGPGGNGRVHFLGYFFLERERSNTHTARRVVARHPAAQLANNLAISSYRLHKL